MKAQLTISVNCGKWLIVKAILLMPQVKNAMHNGKIILKGGTTVSCIAEELLGIKLRISGRITNRGTVGCKNISNAPHSVLVEGGTWRNIDELFVEEALNLKENDIFVIGANTIDIYGNSAMMAGSLEGGNPDRAISAMKIKNNFRRTS